MAFGDVVQSAKGSLSDSAVTSGGLSFSAATAGNLLLVGQASVSAQTWGAAPSGFTLLSQVTDGSGNMSAVWYYKIAAGGETSVTFNWSFSISSQRFLMMEIEGPFAVSPLDVLAEDESNISSAVTSQASGTTATTAQADAVAVAFFAADSASAVDGGRSYNNSFSEVVFGDTSFVARPMAAFALRLLSATGAYSCTYSTTDTGDEMYGAIAVFKAAVAGGPGQPVRSLHQFRMRR